MANSFMRFQRKKDRIRAKLKKISDRNRLSVFRSNKHIYAQIIDDSKSETLVFVSSLDKEIKQENKSNCNKDFAVKVANLLIKKAKEKNIKEVAFDRGGRKYHGVIKTFADEVRKELVF